MLSTMQQKALLTLFLALIASPALSAPVSQDTGLRRIAANDPVAHIGVPISDIFNERRNLDARRKKKGKVGDALDKAADASDVIANGVSVGTDIANAANQRRELEARRRKKGKIGDALDKAADASDVIANGVSVGTDIANAANQRRELEARRRKKGKIGDALDKAADASDVIANGVSVGTDIANAANQRRAIVGDDSTFGSPVSDSDPFEDFPEGDPVVASA